MEHHFLPSSPKRRRWLRDAALAGIAACLLLPFFTSSAGAQTTPTPAPHPTSPATATATPSNAPAADETIPYESIGDVLSAPSTFIDSGLLETLQSSVVGLVIVWEEQTDPWAGFRLESPSEPTATAISLCTGWFNTPTTIVTAGHCVDPAEGRLLLDEQAVKIDPVTLELVAPPPGRPEPRRTVYAFQPRELPGAVITAPTIVRVDDFRKATDGDTAKLEIHGLPPGRPIPIAQTAPRLGEPVTSIGFPGLNIDTTDGVDIDALIDETKGVAEVLQDSRIQPVSTSGTITSRQYREGVALFQTNADLAFGTSGGPTINSRGEVYGINSQITFALFEGGNFNIITDTGMLRDFLDRDQSAATVPPPSAPAPASAVPLPAMPSPAAGSPAAAEEAATAQAADIAGIAVVVSAIGGAAIGAGAVLVIRRRVRGGRSEPSEKRDAPRHRASRRAPAKPDDK